jgi:hypothetical protein
VTELLTPDRQNGQRFGAATPGLPMTDHDAAPAPVTPASRRRSIHLVIPLVVLALVLGAAGYLTGRFTGRGTSVVVLRDGVAAGTLIGPPQVRVAHSTAAPRDAAHSVASVVGMTAARDLPAGAMLTTADIGPIGSAPRFGMALVGMFLKPGQAPAEGLQPGDVVTVVQPPQNDNGQPGNPVVLARRVHVTVAHLTSNGESVSLLVPAGQAVALSAAAAQGNVAVVRETAG